MSPEILLIVLISILIILTAILLFVELRNSGRMNRAVYPLYEYTIKKAQKKAQKIIYDATRQAREILIASELASIKESAEKKVETRKLEETYRQNLDVIARETRQLLGKYAGEAESIYKNLSQELIEQIGSSKESIESESNKTAQDIRDSLNSIKEKVHSTEEKYSTMAARIEDSIDQHARDGKEQLSHSIDAVVNNFSQSLSEIKEDNAQKIDAYLRDEFEKAKEEIYAYKEARMKILDKQIISLVEQVAEITLRKKLSLKEHGELAYQALEEAKKEGIFKDSNT